MARDFGKSDLLPMRSEAGVNPFTTLTSSGMLPSLPTNTAAAGGAPTLGSKQGGQGNMASLLPLLLLLLRGGQVAPQANPLQQILALLGGKR